MRYIDALKLINLSIENQILEESEGRVLVYRDSTPVSKAGWYLSEKDEVAQELMDSEEGQNLLISALEDMGIDFDA